jgi:hypothetical protein
MSKKDNKKEEMIIKYTLMPFNIDDDYEHFFSLSLRELAKNTKDKSLLAPFIVYNSELDVPMDNDLEEYTVYCNQSQILEVIKKQECTDVFRTLILHGFDIDLDEMKDVYIGIARRNNADLCINIIQDTGIDSNITLYIDSSIEKSEGKVWELQKQEMYDEIDSFIDSYDSYDIYDYTPEEIETVETLLEALMGNDVSFFDSKSKKKDKKEEPKEEKKEDNKPDLKLIPLHFQDVEHEDVDIEEEHIAYSFEQNDDVVKLACIDKSLFVIEENDYEVALSFEQMEFIIESYNKIKQYLEKDEPRK